MGSVELLIDTSNARRALDYLNFVFVAMNLGVSGSLCQVKTAF